ncbi:hypothetical protein RJ640_012046 [Escallonia rubra]|uniref:Uncharacterized protein n=1 Tax=Escallonia rubra TaxID=112253 RepID=A0AA88UGF2_9ASTE|nr:hypothetical protein RJ640_012046 [Escallonia rubra]
MGSQVPALEPWCRLDGKVVMVTGASSGLGREFCVDLAKAGCMVVAGARRMDRLKSLCEEINQLADVNPQVASDGTMTKAVRAIAVELDVTADGRTISASVEKAWAAFGHIDALINNAGVRAIMGSQVPDPLEPWCRLDGKVVMVTGASSGLGREFCVDLAKAGCMVVAGARRMDRLKSLCEEINQLADVNPQVASDGTMTKAVRAIAVELDVTADGRTISASVEKAWAAFGHIDALINNAGVRGSIKSSLDWAEEEWNVVVKTNLTGSWLVSKYVGQRMRDAGQGGSIINITSISGLNRAQLRGGAAYSSSKAAMDTLTKIMALELGMHKIRVNSVAPGLFRSEITEDLIKKDWLKNVAMKTVPLQTFGTSDPALTSLVRYLIDDSSGYVSGNVFIVDAGYTLPGLPIFSSL